MRLIIMMLCYKEMMTNKEVTKFKILFGILFIMITLTTIPILVNASMAQQEQGITPTGSKKYYKSNIAELSNRR